MKDKVYYVEEMNTIAIRIKLINGYFRYEIYLNKDPFIIESYDDSQTLSDSFVEIGVL